MSNTFHHRDQRYKHAGQDLWGARPGGGYLSYSSYNKKLTLKRERVEERRILHIAKLNPDTLLA